MLSVWRCDRNNLAMDEINIYYTSSSLLVFITSTTVREKGYDFLMSSVTTANKANAAYVVCDIVEVSLQ